jgi:hypothetical protein
MISGFQKLTLKVKILFSLWRFSSASGWILSVGDVIASRAPVTSMVNSFKSATRDSDSTAEIGYVLLETHARHTGRYKADAHVYFLFRHALSIMK